MRIGEDAVTAPDRRELMVLIAVGIALLIRYPIHFAFSPVYLMDLEAFQMGAQRILSGAGDQLYDPFSASYMMVFKYAPIWALIWMPFAVLPHAVAAVVWTSLIVLWLVLTLLLCAQACRRCGIRPHPLAGLIAVLLILRPMGEEMGNGQLNLQWGLFVAGFIAATLAQRPWLAAVSLSAAILLKLPALIFLPYLVLRGDWKATLRILAICISAIVVSSLLITPTGPLRLVQTWGTVLYRHGLETAFVIGNQSVLVLLSRFLTADGYGLNIANLSHDTLAGMAASLMVGLVFLLGLSARRRPSPARFLYDAALLTIWMVLFSPTAWLATYTTLLIPCFIAIAAILQHARQRRWDVLAIVFGIACLLVNLLTHQKVWRWLGLHAWRGETYLFLVFTVLPWFAVLLTLLLWRLRRPQARPADSTP